MKVICPKCKKIFSVSKIITKIKKTYTCSCGNVNHYVYDLPIDSKNYTTECVRELEQMSDSMSLELKGNVYLLQTKDGEVLIRDQLNSQYVLEALSLIIQESIYERLKDFKEYSEDQTTR